MGCDNPVQLKDLFHGAIFIGTEEDGFETYEWALSRRSDPKISVTATNTAT
jgi:hypothetical protein